ncbi:MAG: ABC transporter permease [Myxococcaceae bacterium]|jgi:ABC-type transport system involved in multi-copper enzyme maturation permease subunit|nr:ABC transporter permease [Myxococcaceae bacterium]MCA3011208.1 ABC transporter permease [Myxococcaceae bacterium]
MRQLLRVALDLLLEATRRRWVLGLFGSITLVLTALGLSLELDVVDGALAGSKLFGVLLSDDVVSAHRALSGVSQAVAYLAFYGGAVFLVVACSDFAPELLSPGRIEHLLSLPVARWQLLFGTYLGVLGLVSAGILYGAVGLTALLGVKTGVWSPGLLLGSTVGLLGFAALYAVMLCSAFFVRSASVSGGAGAAMLGLGVVASYRESLTGLLEPGLVRTLVSWALVPVPRLGGLATMSARIAAEQAIDGAVASRLAAGCGLFSVAALALAAWRFERMDF